MIKLYLEFISVTVWALMGAIVFDDTKQQIINDMVKVKDSLLY